jgi:hypothetical protein
MRVPPRAPPRVRACRNANPRPVYPYTSRLRSTAHTTATLQRVYANGNPKPKPLRINTLAVYWVAYTTQSTPRIQPVAQHTQHTQHSTPVAHHLYSVYITRICYVHNACEAVFGLSAKEITLHAIHFFSALTAEIFRPYTMYTFKPRLKNGALYRKNLHGIWKTAPDSPYICSGFRRSDCLKHTHNTCPTQHKSA